MVSRPLLLPLRRLVVQFVVVLVVVEIVLLRGAKAEAKFILLVVVSLRPPDPAQASGLWAVVSRPL